jgi:hypothetical protein
MMRLGMIVALSALAGAPCKAYARSADAGAPAGDGVYDPDVPWSPQRHDCDSLALFLAAACRAASDLTAGVPSHVAPQRITRPLPPQSGSRWCVHV